MAYDGPPIAPGETKALIDEKGDTLTLLFRDPLSADPTPHALIVPTEQMLLLVCQAVLRQAAYMERRKGSGIVTPSGLPGPGGSTPKM
jgi:hypothetical protein